jgi:TonB family protein
MAITVVLHAAILAGVLYYRHRLMSQPILAPRDFVVARLVRLGQQRPKHLLPVREEPPMAAAPKPDIRLTQNESAVAKPTEPKPTPAEEKALDRAAALARRMGATTSQRLGEGSPDGDPDGTASEAGPGDLYATAVYKLIRSRWNVPASLIPKSVLDSLAAEVLLRIDGSGTIISAEIVKSSGNRYYDDSITEVFQLVKQIPRPPAGVAGAIFRHGLVLEFLATEKR